MRTALALPLFGLVAALAAPAAESGAIVAIDSPFKLNADARYRFETVELQGRPDDRDSLLRLRAGAEAALGDEAGAALRLSTGGHDPAANDQELGEPWAGGRIDLGYLKWNPAAAGGLTLLAGRMEKPFLCVQDLVWDGDFNPDGIAAKYIVPGEGADWLFNAGGFTADLWSDADGVRFLSAQAAVRLKPMEDAHVLLGLGAYDFDGGRGSGPLYGNRAFGNSTTGTGRAAVFAEDYREVEAFGEASADLLIRITAYGQYVVNSALGTGNDGWLAGLCLGRAKAVNSLEVGYNYRRLGADAVVGVLTDSDFAGGGTDAEGHKVYARYQATTRLQFGLAWFADTLHPGGAERDFHRFQADVACRF